MKKTFKTMLALMASTMAFIACQEEDLLGIDTPLPSELKEMTFTATQEGQYEKTKTTIDGIYVKWASGDKISVFDGGPADADGHLDREFSLIEGAGTKSGTFSGSASEDASVYYALYPYMSSSSEERVPTKAEAEAAAGFHLSAVDAHDAAADDLGDVGAGVDTEGDAGDHNTVAAGDHDDEVHDHELDDHRGAADDGQINTADGVGKLQQEGAEREK